VTPPKEFLAGQSESLEVREGTGKGRRERTTKKEGERETSMYVSPRRGKLRRNDGGSKAYETGTTDWVKVDPARDPREKHRPTKRERPGSKYSSGNLL